MMKPIPTLWLERWSWINYEFAYKLEVEADPRWVIGAMKLNTVEFFIEKYVL